MAPVNLSNRVQQLLPKGLKIVGSEVDAKHSMLSLKVVFSPVPGSACVYKFCAVGGESSRCAVVKDRDDQVGEKKQGRFEFVLTGLTFKERYELHAGTKCEGRIPEESGDVFIANLTTPPCLLATGFNLAVCHAPPPRDLIVMIEPSIAGLKNDSTLALTWSPPFASAQPMLPVNYTYEVYWNAIYEKDGMPDSLRYFGPKTYETKNNFVTIPNIECGRGYKVGVRAKGGRKGYGESVEKSIDATACFIPQLPSSTPSANLASRSNWQELETPTNMIILGICLLVSALLVLMLGYFFKRHCKKRRRDSSPAPLIVHRDKKSVVWNDVYLPSATPARPEELPACSYEIQLYPPYAGSVKSDRLRYVDHIAKGAFGSVDHYHFVPDTARPKIDVAIKTVKGVESGTERDTLKKEIDVLKKLPPHPNVVALIGSANTERGSSQDIFLVLEYCDLGDLKRLLLGYNSMATSSNPTDRLRLACRLNEFLDFGAQIAAGMDHLARHQIVHRDLAARNVLVTAEYKMKVTDFGLARRITSTYYRRQEIDAKLPLKWLAPEVFGLQNQHSTKSDVWSFGVLLHEIFSLGATPYPTVNHPRDLELFLQTGRRMEAPSNCHPDVYKLMLMCWRENPRERPDFSALIGKLKVLRRREDKCYVPFIVQPHTYTTIYGTDGPICSGNMSTGYA